MKDMIETLQVKLIADLQLPEEQTPVFWHEEERTHYRKSNGNTVKGLATC
jgi:hypothetical protein